MSEVMRFEEVSRWYGQVLGLNKVTCSLEPGITGLLGPNGAGKSTFLKLALGLLKPSAGTVTTLGLPVWDNPAMVARLGYCPEIDNFYEQLSGQAFVALMLRLSGYAAEEAERRAREALDQVGLASKDAARRIRQYSKGMRQKVKVAQAIAGEPELLVLDEPFTGADPPSRRRLIELLKARAEAGVHVLLSSHVLHEIEALTETMLLIDHGRILAEGGVQNIRALIDEHPHRIRLLCDDPRALAKVALDLECVSGVRLVRGGVELSTADPLLRRAAGAGGRARHRSARGQQRGQQHGGGVPLPGRGGHRAAAGRRLRWRRRGSPTSRRRRRWPASTSRP